MVGKQGNVGSKLRVTLFSILRLYITEILKTLILTSCAAFWSKEKLWEILFFQVNTKFEMACLMMSRSGIKTFESPDNPLTMMPEGQHGIFSSCAKWGFVNILAGTHETHVFRDASRDLCFVGAVIDHDEQAANDEVIGHLGE